MSPTPILLYHQEPSCSDVRLARLSQMLGVSCRLLSAAASCQELEKSLDHSLCVLTSASTLYELSPYTATMECLFRKAQFLFVYGFRPQSLHNSLACFLTEGLISGVSRFTHKDLEYHVASSHPELTREFSGLSFGPIDNNVDFAFTVPSLDARVQPLICVGSMPFWIALQKGQCTLFMLACDEITDINQRVDGKLSVVEHFSRLLPAAMFIRFVFEEACWHVRRRLANLIIDDPLLRESYGFLNYRRLLVHMDRGHCCATIAFIPWNYKRTHQTVADLFRQRADRLSICVHGCDHSEAEFAQKDPGRLNVKIRLASDRMKAHEASTGVPYSEVMVFPQGRFSTQSLMALKSNNYLAAVNSGATPTDVENELKLTVADHLTPAISKYGYPLFVRRYPGKLEDFACDLFFGKPALLVEHHGSFRDDGVSLLEFVSKLNSLTRELEWAGLRDVVVRTYLERDISERLTLCKIYINEQIIENHSKLDKNYVIMKYEDGDVSVEKVLINGEDSRFTLSNNQLRLRVKIPAKQSANVRIVYRNTLPALNGRECLIGRGRVWGRRMLSELRDNVLCRNEHLLAAAYAAKRRLFRSP